MMAAGREAIEAARAKGITDPKILSDIGTYSSGLVGRLRMTYDDLVQFVDGTLDDLDDFSAITIDFDPDLISHIFKGEVNAAGELTGFHYEGFQNAIASVKPGTTTPLNSFGVYEAEVISGSLAKTRSSFFPKNWTPRQVTEAINDAYMRKAYVSSNLYRATLPNGMRIEMRLDSMGRILTAYPLY